MRFWVIPSASSLCQRVHPKQKPSHLRGLVLHRNQYVMCANYTSVCSSQELLLRLNPKVEISYMNSLNIHYTPFGPV
uniref:Putative ovule protein n=1 Tax=Solanum chacoense TaxID=4108 RepID=A0A0V0GH77_SOLCH